MANLWRPRETVIQEDEEDWTDWVKAMVPQNAEGNNLKRRGRNHIGSICTNIRNAFPRCCGIYEWRATRCRHNYVVYVGSTCRGKPGALRQRIYEYCRNGSHKANLINDALNRGYELWVRVKISKEETIEDAENMENELLERYNYAWNVRNNTIRNILPWGEESWVMHSYDDDAFVVDHDEWHYKLVLACFLLLKNVHFLLDRAHAGSILIQLVYWYVSK